jgi:hypothetical protein
MKKLLLLSVILSVLVSCVGRKQIESQLNSGNYDQAITNALKKLENSKDKQRKQSYVKILKEAFSKVVDEDLQTIAQFQKDGNPEYYKRVYNMYLALNARQNAVKSVTPLKINDKTVNFNFKNYTDNIVDYRYKTSEHLIDKGIDLLDSKNKYDSREAHIIFSYVESINPNFEENRDLLIEAHEKGTDYVSVSIKNQTQQIIPKRLEEDLLDFDTYGLNEFWTVYHAYPNDSLVYDYDMQLQLKQINISPESINERQLLRKREVVDGWKYQLDAAGNVEKDSLGNDIKVDKIINVKARFFEVVQTKTSQVIAEVVYTDLKQNQVLEAFPIDSGFVFENIFGKFKGDKRALNKEDRRLLSNRRMGFPSNEQMVYDTGEDLKLKLKNIITRYKFRS